MPIATIVPIACIPALKALHTSSQYSTKAARVPAIAAPATIKGPVAATAAPIVVIRGAKASTEAYIAGIATVTRAVAIPIIASLNFVGIASLRAPIMPLFSTALAKSPKAFPASVIMLPTPRASSSLMPI